MEDRSAEVLARLLVEPDAALRAARSEMIERVRYKGDPVLRRQLAEHYRALRAPDQAARWGIVEPGWARASEVRALRLALIAEGPFAVHDYLGLQKGDPMPTEVADLALQTPDAGACGCVWLLAAVSAAVWAVYVLVSGLVEVERGDRPQVWMVLSAVIAAGFVVASVWFLVRSDSSPTAREAALLDERRALTEQLPARERNAAARAELRTETWGHAAGPPQPARARLVDDARRRGDRAGAARWGIVVDGMTTLAERDALVRVLRATEEPVSALVRLSRRPWDAPFSPEEIEVLHRAGGDEARMAAAHEVETPYPPVRWLARWSAPLGVAVVVLPIAALIAGLLADGPLVATAARTAMAAAPALLAGSLATAGLGTGDFRKREGAGFVAIGLALAAAVVAVTAG